ncbi:hypothetical protein D3C73_460550 [compost metagenome]
MIETDQQEGGDRGQLPIDEEHQETVGDDKAEHRTHEQEDEGQEPSQMPVPLQVTAGIDHDQGTDTGDQQREGQRQAIDEPGERKVEAGHPRISTGRDLTSRDFRQKTAKMQKGQCRRRCNDPGCLVTKARNEEWCQNGGKERQEERNKRPCRRGCGHNLSCPHTVDHRTRVIVLSETGSCLKLNREEGCDMHLYSQRHDAYLGSKRKERSCPRSAPQRPQRATPSGAKN